MRKRYFTACFIILLVLIGILLYSLSNNKTSWDNMQIKDFKISSFKDSWNSYPFPAEKISPEMMNSFIPNIKQNIDKTEVYKWKINNNIYAFIYIIQLKDKPSGIVGENFIKSGQRFILNEEIYTYEVPITYENKRENMNIYLFDEDKFVFIVGGVWSLPEGLIKKLVDKYPSKPTPSNFNIDNEAISQLKDYVSKMS